MSDKPRPLSEDEIEDIVSVIPKIKSAIELIGDINRANIIENYIKVLRVKKVKPSTIPNIKRILTNRFRNAEIPPGTPVGPRAAEAVAVPMIQGTLDSFKTSGAAISTYGEQTANEIISLGARSPEIIRLYFNTLVSDVEILRDKMPDLVEIKVSGISFRAEDAL